MGQRRIKEMIHILVVDDDVRLNNAICTFLNDCGFEAKGMPDAKAAYDEMYNNLYDLIVSDIMMPDIDGFELGLLEEYFFHLVCAWHFCRNGICLAREWQQG